MGNKGIKILADELIGSQSFVNSSNFFGRIEEEIKYLNMSYSDTYLDDGGFSSPPLGIIKIQRRG